MKSCSLARRARRSFFSRISDSVGMDAFWCRVKSEPNFEAMSRAFSVELSASESEWRSLGVDGVEFFSSLSASAL